MVCITIEIWYHLCFVHWEKNRIETTNWWICKPDKLKCLKVQDFQKKMGIIYRLEEICRFPFLNSSFEFSRIFCYIEQNVISKIQVYSDLAYFFELHRIFWKKATFNSNSIITGILIAPAGIILIDNLNRASFGSGLATSSILIFSPFDLFLNLSV